MPQKTGIAKLLYDGLQQGQVLTKQYRTFPDFLIIGVMKGGTSSLFYHLLQHPQILKPLQKELRFFSRNYTPDRSEYQKFFPLKATQQVKARLIRKPVITGEATPNYFFYPTAASRVWHHLPNVKLIVLLRNPVDRAYSHYQHLITRSAYPYTFEEAIQKELEELPAVRDRYFSNPLIHDYRLTRFSLLERGKYSNHLARWLSYFASQQLKVFSSERFFQDPARVYQEATAFLGLDPDHKQEFKPRNINQYDPLSSETREWLVNFYRPYNQALVNRLGASLPWAPDVKPETSSHGKP
jgi:hypothetical protein